MYFVETKGIYIVEERNGKTYTQPLTKSPNDVAKIGEQIKTLFDIDLAENPSRNGNQEENDMDEVSKLASSYMKQLYNELENIENSEDQSEEDVKTWLSADKIVSTMSRDTSHRLSDGSYRILFSRDDLPTTNGQTVQKAQIRVHIRGILSPILFYIDDPSLPSRAELISSDDPVFISDITSLVEKWTSPDDAMLPLLNIHSSSENSLELDAFLVIALKEDGVRQTKRRTRRAIDATPLTIPESKRHSIRRSTSAYFEKLNVNSLCQKKGLYVDFDALGWKQWVIAPEGFSAFYCAGTCSAPFHKTMNATSHAIVQSLIHLVRPNATSEAKCAPSQLSSMKILFMDQKKNVQIKRYRDMVVQECGCH